MKIIILVLLFVLTSELKAQDFGFKNGDLIFQESDKSSMSDAIK